MWEDSPPSCVETERIEWEAGRGTSKSPLARIKTGGTSSPSRVETEGIEVGGIWPGGLIREQQG